MNSNANTHKRFLVTGARGFIGTHLVDALARSGSVVTAVDTAPLKKNIGGTNITHVVGDVRDREKMQEIFGESRFDCVFDLASFAEVGHPGRSYQRNIEQTRAMIDYCQSYQIEKYLFFSSQFVFRKPGLLPASEQDFAPVDAYGESKMQSEILVRESLPLDRWIILRPTYIWGPGLARFRDGLLYRLIKGQMLVGSDPKIVRYYGYVKTIVNQTIALARHPFSELPSKVYYLSDEAIHLSDFCAELIRAAGTGRTRHVPNWVIRLGGNAGSLSAFVGGPSPINAMQARELTTNFPVPVSRTLALTNIETNLPEAAAETIAWASENLYFQSAVGKG